MNLLNTLKKILVNPVTTIEHPMKGATGLNRSLQGPTYVFAHIISPHPPFVFGSDGEETDPPRAYNLADGTDYFKFPGTNLQSYYKAYTNQLRYINSLLLKMVDGILTRAERPTVIILQSDHGPRSGLDWEYPEKTNVKETLSIFSSYYFHDGDYADLHENISPVNTFRVVLNKYFGYEMELLEDLSYFSTKYYPYNFM